MRDPGHQPTDELPRPAFNANDLLPDPPDGRASVTAPPNPPTGITITNIEAVTDGYDYEGNAIFDLDSGYSGPFGSSHPESIRGRRSGRGWGSNRASDQGSNRASDRAWRALGDDDGEPSSRRSPAFSRDGVSPMVIIIAVALLVIVILAAVFFS